MNLLTLEIEIQSESEMDKGVLADKIREYVETLVPDFEVIYVSKVREQRIIEGL